MMLVLFSISFIGNDMPTLMELFSITEALVIINANMHIPIVPLKLNFYVVKL